MKEDKEREREKNFAHKIALFRDSIEIDGIFECTRSIYANRITVMRTHDCNIRFSPRYVLLLLLSFFVFGLFTHLISIVALFSCPIDMQ